MTVRLEQPVLSRSYTLPFRADVPTKMRRRKRMSGALY